MRSSSRDFCFLLNVAREISGGASHFSMGTAALPGVRKPIPGRALVSFPRVRRTEMERPFTDEAAGFFLITVLAFAFGSGLDDFEAERAGLGAGFFKDLGADFFADDLLTTGFLAADFAGFFAPAEADFAGLEFALLDIAGRE